MSPLPGCAPTTGGRNLKAVLKNHGILRATSPGHPSTLGVQMFGCTGMLRSSPCFSNSSARCVLPGFPIRKMKNKPTVLFTFQAQREGKWKFASHKAL